MQAIFITGAGSGIGRATAQMFAAKGWRVGLADIDEAGLAGTAALLPADATSIHVMDVRDREAWTDALDRFVALTDGRLDVLFNNAGVLLSGALTEASFEMLDRVVAINLVGVLNGAHIGHAYLAKTPGACLLNMASAAAIYGSAYLATYSATKAAVCALTQALDGEWHAQGIRVRAILPGFIDTPLLQGDPARNDRSTRDMVVGAGLELTDAATVAQTAWDAVHADPLFRYVGPTAKKLAFAARWMPGPLRKRLRRGLG